MERITGKVCISISLILEILKINNNTLKPSPLPPLPPPNSNSSATTSFTGHSLVRGLECDKSILGFLRRSSKTIRDTILKQIVPMLERWAARASQLGESYHLCVIHTHLALILQCLKVKLSLFYIIIIMLSSKRNKQTNKMITFF